MKKTISVLLVLLMVLSLSACGVSRFNGTYKSEDGDYRLIMKNGKVKWYESGFFFEGTYTVEKGNIFFEIEGSGFFPDTVFDGTVEGKNFILHIGRSDILFVKQ